MFAWKTEDGRYIHGFYCLHERPKGFVVLVHGFSESALKLSEAADRFFQNGYSVLCYDQAGHGYSARWTDDPSLICIDSFDTYVHDLLLVAARAKVLQGQVPLHVFAHSMGGAVAILAAEKQPDLFERMILSAPMAEPRSGSVPWTTTRILAISSVTLGMKKSYVAGQQPYHRESFEDCACTSRERFDWYAGLRDPDWHYHTVAASWNWLYEAARASERILQIQTAFPPVLLLQAQNDTFVSNAAQDLFLEHIAPFGWTRKIVYPHTKHELYNSTEDVLTRYWSDIFAYLDEPLSLRPARQVRRVAALHPDRKERWPRRRSRRRHPAPLRSRSKPLSFHRTGRTPL